MFLIIMTISASNVFFKNLHIFLKIGNILQIQFIFTQQETT